MHVCVAMMLGVGAYEPTRKERKLWAISVRGQCLKAHNIPSSIPKLCLTFSFTNSRCAKNTSARKFPAPITAYVAPTDCLCGLSKSTTYPGGGGIATGTPFTKDMTNVSCTHTLQWIIQNSGRCRVPGVSSD